MASGDATPGVYIEEVASGSMPIQGVGTAVAAFVGYTAAYDSQEGDRDDPDGVKPQLITSWPQYERVYGGFAPGAMLPHAVRGFFENGGSTCYVVRVAAGGPGQPTASLRAGRGDIPSIKVTAREQLTGPAEVEVVAPPPPAEGEEPSTEYTLRVFSNGDLREELTGVLGQNPVGTAQECQRGIPVHPYRAAGRCRRRQLGGPVPAPGRYPLEVPPPAAVEPAALEGSESDRTGYQGLAIAEDVTMVAVPDLLTIARREDGSVDEPLYLGIQKQLVDWCATGKTRMAILDPPPAMSAAQALAWRERLQVDSPLARATTRRSL